jgi:UDP-N-acetylglucosamine 2-epimerase
MTIEFEYTFREYSLMSPGTRKCKHQILEYSLFHIGQNYSYTRDRIFFEQLNLSLPKYNLDVLSRTNGIQTAAILSGIENILQKYPPGMVLVKGIPTWSVPEPLPQTSCIYCSAR